MYLRLPTGVFSICPCSFHNPNLGLKLSSYIWGILLGLFKTCFHAFKMNGFFFFYLYHDKFGSLKFYLCLISTVTFLLLELCHCLIILVLLLVHAQILCLFGLCYLLRPSKSFLLDLLCFLIASILACFFFVFLNLC